MPTLGVFGQGNSATVFVPVQCVEASSLTTGYGAAYAVGNSLNGNAVVMTRSGTAANLPGFLGVAKSDIASNAYGLVQSFGFALSVWISNVGTSVTINAGDPLIPGAVAGGLISGVPTYAASGFRYIIASNLNPAISATGYVSGIVRCL